MSIQFHDGPARGQHLMLRSAPLALRVVESSRGNFDALDQPEDVANPQEKIHVYHRMGPATWMHIRAAKRSDGGRFWSGTYRLFDEQPADALIRARPDWLNWLIPRERLFRAFDQYTQMRFLEQRGWCGVAPQLFTCGLFHGLTLDSYAGRFCYAKTEEAMEALRTWDGSGDPPGPWIKEKPSDRLGPGADGVEEQQ
jgi:hypothetical protein